MLNRSSSSSEHAKNLRIATSEQCKLLTTSSVRLSPRPSNHSLIDLSEGSAVGLGMIVPNERLAVRYDVPPGPVE